MPLPTLSNVLLGLAILYFAKLVILRRKAFAPLPPGPKPNPTIGNLRDLPRPGQQEWIHWLTFKELYVPIFQTIVILNDHQVAFDLMEKRSTIYLSRPRMIFAGEMVGWENALTMQGYSDVEVRRFLLRVLQKPDNLIRHVRTEAGAMILKIAYGYNIEPKGRDPLIDLANESVDIFAGTWLVDTISLFKYIPTWFPGAEFKRRDYAWRKTLLTTIEKPYQLVKQQMHRGSYPPSYLASLLEQGDGKLNAEEEFVSKWTAGILYLGGADTVLPTVSSLSCFFLAMALYPEAQRKAQEEIDRILGPNRLPTLDDRHKLPYIDAMVKETFRWHPVGPMGVPYSVTEDEVYAVYLIPKGALILPNIWAFTHDPNVYREPETFRPERFLGDKPELNPYTTAFDETVFLSIAQSLTVFNFSKPEGEDDLQPEFLPGVISHLAPYRLDISPRSAVHEALIHSVEVEHPWEESHAKELQKVEC
ncbi:cytochrome P450 [Aspergillus tamarii]|uniref:Cytochrome P450 n=1 Tax=Aspergillus tamarii TaxID=41984 RepID=A0A5N6UJ55_ASPTM|nr:cytochrome P450 [Aspergillus tamarii]